MKRKSRIEIDTSPYQGLLEEALVAFRSDVSYAVAIARAAVIIENKRKTWKSRSEMC